MKNRIKNILAFIFIFTFAFCLPLCFQANINTVNAVSLENKNFYYYNQLGKNDLAKRFYTALYKMTSDDDFKTGQLEYNLADVLTQDELSGYLVDNLPKVPVSFSSAKDAFYMDHPEIFYMDIYKLSLSAGIQNGNYVAFIGTGRADNYYLDNSFKNKTDINSAIDAFGIKLNAIVLEAKQKENVVEQIKFVNNKLANDVSYDYGAYNDVSSGQEIYNGNVYSSYGALVENKAVCAGYARAFKVVMDELKIPCVLIQGSAYAGGGAEGLESHMWNAVQIDSLWYGVDVTWNSTSGNGSKYLLVGDDYLSKTHFEDPVISSSGYTLRYPKLRPFNYGVNEGRNGFVFKDSGTIITKDAETFQMGYSKDTDSQGYSLTLGVSYNGKDAKELEKIGEHLAISYGDEKGVWTSWVGIAAYSSEGGYSFGEGFTIAVANASVYNLRFAIIDYAPDFVYLYNSSNLSDDHIIAISDIYTNDAFGTYRPAPSVKRKTPNYSGAIESFNPFDITLEYDEELVPIEGKTVSDVGLSVKGTHSDISIDSECIKIENLVWNAESKTLSFRFTPSKQYQHNVESYYFVPTNLVGKDSQKVPDPAVFTFKMKQVLCNKIFEDGRLYIKTFGDPQLVDTKDLSMTGFTDKNGNSVAGNQRSQLMLVVNELSTEESKNMEDALLANNDIGLEKSDIKSSATYQIDLQLCGRIQKIPNNSYLQVGFGFPEGYGPNSAGVTFTAYHYTLNVDGTIKSVEQIPCVITEYGIIATVESFSPFMICCVDSSKVTSTKSIYASVNGIGGRINETKVSSLSQNENVNYVLTAEDGYKLNKVLLNGVEVDLSSKVDSEGNLSFTYEELSNNNVVEVSFISNRVALRNEEANIQIIEPKLVVTSNDMLVSGLDDSNEQDTQNNLGIILGVILAVVVVTAATSACVVIMRKKKKSTKK